MRHVARLVLRNRRRDDGIASLEWLLVTAGVAAIVATAVVVVQVTVRDVGIEASQHRARFRTAEIAADALTREWRAHTPSDQFEAAQINRRYGERCARLGVTHAASEARPSWTPGVLDAGGGWRERHKIPICHVRDVRGERERFGEFVPDP